MANGQSNWGAASYMLQKDVQDETKELEGAAQKRGLWQSIGSTVGGLGAMALTGGVVNPLTAALITGGLSAAGGMAGRAVTPGAGRVLRGEREGGGKAKFLHGERKELRQGMTGDLLTSAATSAFTAGVGAQTRVADAKSLARQELLDSGMDAKAITDTKIKEWMAAKGTSPKDIFKPKSFFQKGSEIDQKSLLDSWMAKDTLAESTNLGVVEQPARDTSSLYNQQDLGPF